jgi:hypothetical protein
MPGKFLHHILPGIILAIVVTSFLGHLTAPPSLATPYYSFGKNKVQYRKLHWKKLKSLRVDLYYYPEEEDLARIACDIAEEACDEFEQSFDYYLRERVSIILYNSHSTFEQTNILPFLLPESVGGFMEFMKKRIVIPHDGSLRNLTHVIRHELVHLFTFEKLDHVLKLHQRRISFPPPLWFTEGLAEYLSIGWDTRADMVVREALFSGNLVQVEDLWKINGSYLMYKEGQSIVHFLSNNYGDNSISLLLDEWWKADDFEELVQTVYGFDFEGLNERWIYSLQKRYFPDYSEHDPVDFVAEKIFDEGSINVKVVSVPPPEGENRGGAEEIVFITDRAGYPQICLAETRDTRLDEPNISTLVKEGQEATFESLHIMKSDMSINNSRELVFVSKENECDVLQILQIDTRKITEKYRFEELVTLSSPDWDPCGDRIAFRGVDYHGIADIYLYDTKSGILRNITQDPYDDHDPVWTPDSRKIIYSSDRHSTSGHLAYSIWSIGVVNHKAEPLVTGDYDAIHPAPSPDGRYLLYVSDEQGIYNVYVLDMDTRHYARISATYSGLFDPEWSKHHGDRFYVSAYTENRYLIYRFSFPDMVSWKPGHTLAKDEPREPYQADIDTKKEDYSIRFGFDIVQGIVQYDMNIESGTGTQIALSDMMGDHSIFLLLGNSSLSWGHFWDNFNIALSYANLSRRVNYSFGAFRFTNQYLDYFRNDFLRERVGVVGIASYPFSKFSRIDFGMIGEKRDTGEIFSHKMEQSVLITAYTSLVNDTAYWLASDPIEGHRYNISLWNRYNATSGRIESTSLLTDLRYYLRLTKRTCLALRLLQRKSFGLSPELFYMGGSLTFRGYKRYHFIGKNLFLFNTEYRFPFIDELLFVFPHGSMEFWNIRGALFFDAGNAWYDRYHDLMGSFGLSFRMLLAYSFVCRFDIAKKTDFHRIFNDTSLNFFIGASY